MNPRHENNLTRAFLICLDNIPIVQKEFFKLVSKSVNSELFNVNFPLDSILEETYTQISNRNSIINREDLLGRKLISVLLSDERLSGFSDIKNDERNAIYDGVLLCKPNLLFVIENKPNIKNVWEKQLSPNVREELEIEIVEAPCSISWSEIILVFNNLLKVDILSSVEKRLLVDFLSYIDLYRPELNPYINFYSCNGNKELINKRCKGVLSNIQVNGEYKTTKYHPGWGNYIPSGKNTVTQIKIDYFEENNVKYVRLDMVAADTQSASKESYRLLNREKLITLMKDDSIELESNFHYQHMNKNILWFKGKINVIDYVNFWKSNQDLLKQISRYGNDKTYSFDEFNLILLKNGIIDETELNGYEQRIASKKYMTLNICAGFKITKLWTLEKAIQLDNDEMFIENARFEIERIYEIFNQSIL